MKRCAWVPEDKPLYVKYHDQEWGVPVHDDRHLFEMIILEVAHAGLSWWTILQKRETYREAFDNFDVEKVAAYGEEKIAELLQNSGIVRNKLKVRSAVRNAKVFIEIQKEWGSFDAYLWHWVDGGSIENDIKTREDVVATSPLSDEISKDLK